MPVSRVLNAGAGNPDGQEPGRARLLPSPPPPVGVSPSRPNPAYNNPAAAPGHQPSDPPGPRR